MENQSVIQDDVKTGMTTTQAAEALGVSVSRVLHLLKAGRLTGDPHEGHYWTIDPESVATFKRLGPGRPKGKGKYPAPINLTHRQVARLAEALRMTQIDLLEIIERARKKPSNVTTVTFEPPVE